MVSFPKPKLIFIGDHASLSALVDWQKYKNVVKIQKPENLSLKVVND